MKIFEKWNQKIFNQIFKAVCIKHENFMDNFEYTSCKSKLDQLYQEKANSTRIKSKCDW